MRHDIILIISSRRGIIDVAIGGSRSRGTNKVTIHNTIIVVFGISTTVVVAVGNYYRRFFWVFCYWNL